MLVNIKCAKAAFKITFFCALVTIFLYLFHCSQKTIMLLLTTIVIAERASFNPEYNDIKNSCLSFVVIILSNLLGGVTAFYWPLLNKIITILYATLTFYIPKTRKKFTIFMLGSIVFIVTSASPFNFSTSIMIFVLATIIAFCFQLYNILLNNKQYLISKTNSDFIDNNSFRALIVFSALVIAFVLGAYIQHFYKTLYTYWIMLTIVAVVQTSKSQTVIIALKRMLVNVVGAILVVLLFHFLPNLFWLNLIILFIILFGIFLFWTSGVGRIFFLEMFVFSVIHIIGSLHTSVAFDRVIFTVMGGLIVIGLLVLFTVIYEPIKRLTLK